MDDAETILAIRMVLERLIAGKSVSKKVARSALELLDQSATRSGGMKVVRGGAEVEYVVEQSANGETLAERRKTGKAKPFRCPKPIYDAAVEVLAKSEQAIALGVLIAKISDMLDEPPPDFQVRVVLRLWMQTKPSLITRNRARYRPADSATFRPRAADLWAELKIAK